MPNSVTPSIPLNTAIPSDRRISAPAPLATHQRNDAENERERSHQDRPQAKPRGFLRRVEHRFPLAVQLLGELDDQNRILASQADQHDQSDLHEDIDVADA